eukprot:CAMPEP_0170070434 /NCGR_PEP_ID=MMETSP0019_2-20121128/8728_1 /TAXON_ID=98059 /ORGANISM="Dinobryon sp., Strain UTEXLB2267" /LENGTH=224 /DNA_ID=CAMNT_0010278713 /DNA_START=185 /DNA_END=859 /DNA_ORIENTATION=-
MVDENDYDFSSNTPDKGVLPCETAANFYDFMEDPDLERDCPTIDEVGAWISFYISSQSKKSAMNSNNSHLYDMLCCFAYDSVSTTQKTTNSQELYLMTTTAFCDVFDHLFLRDEFQKLVLDKFPNKTWPPSFISYLHALQDSVPTAVWLSKNAKAHVSHDVSTHKKLLFGFNVIINAKKAFSKINNHYNRRYKHPHELKSGYNISEFCPSPIPLVKGLSKTIFI